jgi:serine/threonine protein kinase
LLRKFTRKKAKNQPLQIKTNHTTHYKEEKQKNSIFLCQYTFPRMFVDVTQTISFDCINRYFGAQRLTEKCDVYSFGVVLLEIITWVRQRLNRQNIEDVVDPRILQDDYDVNVAWKAVDIALKCTERAPEQRPTMTGVVTQLQECLMLEDGSVVTQLQECLMLEDGGVVTQLQELAAVEETPYSIIAFVMEHVNFRSLPTTATGPLTI